MAEREEIEEHEEGPRRRSVRPSPYAPLTASEYAVRDRQLATAEAEEVEEQLADDIEQLHERRAGWQSPYAAPGVPLSPQQAERERALDDAAARADDAPTDDAEVEDEQQLPPRRRGAVEGRVHGTWARQHEQEEYEEWVHAKGLRGGPEAQARWRAERAAAAREDAERAATDDAEQPRHDDAERAPETDDREPGTLRRVGRASAGAVGRAVADLDRRVADDAEREEPRREREEVGGWLSSGQAASLGGWRSEAGWGLDEWLEREERTGSHSASWF